jgi:hypothetical protein
MKIVCGAPLLVVGSSRSRALRGEGRLALRKGEGGSEDLSSAKCWLQDSTPHLSPLPCKGRGEQMGRVLSR